MAMMTAELASAMPSHSGFILWGKQAWGPLVPFLDGWMYACLGLTTLPSSTSHFILAIWAPPSQTQSMMVVAIFDQALYPLIFVDYLKVSSSSSSSSSGADSR